MNRTIKFRGFYTNPQTKVSKMVYGDYVFERYVDSGMDREGERTIESNNGGKSRLDFTCYTVSEKSVGQFTGLTDKNGKEIYEGDIVQDRVGSPFPIKWGAYECYQSTAYGWNCHNDGSQYEIVGNIYENPELLK